MVNGVSEKGFSVNQKVKIGNFPGGTSEKNLEKVDDIIKELPGDLIVHVWTNDLTNNVNLLTNVKKIFNKISKESPSTSIAFSSIINRKDKTNIQKTLTDTNARLKNFYMQKGISFFDNSSIKEFHLGKRKLHLNKKGNSAFAKNLLHHINRTDWSFIPYDLVTVNDCLSDTLEKAKSGTNSSLQTIRKDNLNKLIFAHLNINSIRNKFDSLADIIKDNIDILMISETKVDDSFPDGQFFLDGFGTPFRLDRNRNGGGIMLFIRNDIPAKVVSTDDRPIESFYVELNFRKKKWLLNCSYNPKHSSIESHLDSLSKSIDSLSSRYDNFALLSGFNFLHGRFSCENIWWKLQITKSYKRANMF